MYPSFLGIHFVDATWVGAFEIPKLYRKLLGVRLKILSRSSRA